MHTVISAFDDRQTAQQAIDRLIQAGFARDDVHLEAGMRRDTSSSAGTGTTGREGEKDEGFLASIGQFFASLFGEGNQSDEAGVYTEAMRRGSSLVIVDAQSETEGERAADLLRQLGAIDIDRRAEQWRASGWSGPQADMGSQRTGTTPQAADMARSQDAASTQARDSSHTAASMQAGDSTRSDVAGEPSVLNVVQEELQVGKRT